VGTLQGGANVLNEAQNMLLGIPNAIIAAHDYLTGDTWQQLGSQWSQNLVVPNDPAYSVSMGLAGAGLSGLSLGASAIPGMVGYVGNAGNLVDAGTVAQQSLVTAVPYGDLSGTLPEGFQANHLNQNAAFGSVISQDEGLAVGMRGNAITEPGTPHFSFHQSLERFWDQYRPNRTLFGSVPTNAEYGQALQNALQAAGYSPPQAADLAAQAAAQRAAYGLPETAPVPRVPGRLNQVQP
jgi:hypothetical protein